MSDLPVEALSYRAVVAEYFLGLRGAGLMISPLDIEQVEEWERRGLPVAVVCRGLRRGFEEMLRSRPAAAPLPRSIRAYRLAVEEEWGAYRAGRVGEAPAPSGDGNAGRGRLEAALALVEGAGRATDGKLRDGHREVWRLLAAERARAPLAAERVESLLAAADDLLLAAWVRSLALAERAALGPRLALLAGGRPEGAHRRAHRDALRVHLSDAARAAGLLRLRGAV